MDPQKTIGMQIKVDGTSLADEVVKERMRAVVELARAIHRLADAIASPVVSTVVSGCTITNTGTGVEA